MIQEENIKSENTPLNNAVDFLLYSYFKITIQDGDCKDDTVIDSAIEKAYADAVMEGAFNALPNKTGGNIKDAKENGINAIKKEVVCLLKKKQFDTAYDSWHEKLCKELVEYYKDVKCERKDPAFSYGNAQKWVNMTMKYIYVLDLILKQFHGDCIFCKQYHERINEMAKDFHIPVDRYIINRIWETKECENIELPVIEGKNRKKDYKDPSEYVEKWSRWNYDNYRKFQDSVKKCEYFNEENIAIDWEGSAWILGHR